MPSVRRSIAGTDTDRIVIVASGSGHGRAQLFHSPTPAVTDPTVNIYAALAAGLSGPPSDRATMVAVRRGSHSHLSNSLFCGTGADITCRQTRLGRKNPHHGISAAQCLETSQAEPTALVLIMYRIEVKYTRQAVQGA